MGTEAQWEWLYHLAMGVMGFIIAWSVAFPRLKRFFQPWLVNNEKISSLESSITKGEENLKSLSSAVELNRVAIEKMMGRLEAGHESIKEIKSTLKTISDRVVALDNRFAEHEKLCTRDRELNQETLKELKTLHNEHDKAVKEMMRDFHLEIRGVGERTSKLEGKVK